MSLREIAKKDWEPICEKAKISLNTCSKFYKLPPEAISLLGRGELGELLGVDVQAVDKVLSTIKTDGPEVVPLGKIKQKYSIVPTGIRDFDEKSPWAVDGVGGLRSSYIHEFAGEFGVGKTILAIQVGISAIATGFTKYVFYIDTEGALNPNVVINIASRFGVDDIEERFLRVMPMNAEEIVDVILTAMWYVAKFGVRYIAVDSITAIHRAQFPGREHLQARQQHLNYILSLLRRLCRTFDLVVVVTNQVMAVPVPFAHVSVPVGGNIIAHGIDARFVMKRPNKKNPEGVIETLDVPGVASGTQYQYEIRADGLY